MRCASSCSSWATRRASGAPGLAGRPELLLAPARGPRDDRVRGRQDVGGGAVVLLKLHHPCTGEVLVEVEDVAHVGAAPAVDGLVVVAHHADVLPLPAEQAQEPVLRGVGVLELVDEHVAEAGRPARQQLGVPLEQLGGAQQQISEVDRAGAGQRPLVAAPDLQAPLGLHVVVLEADRGGRVAQVLPAVDAGEHLARTEAAVVGDAHVGEDSLHEALLVVVVVDGEGGRQPGPRRLPPQEPGPEGVEGLDPGVGSLEAEQVPEPLPHLARRLVGEGDREHVPGGDAPLPDQVGDAVHDDPGLAGAGSGQHEERPVPVQHGLALGVVQGVEDGIREAHGGAPYLKAG